jgi:OOP family OmpA-OmpF porin
MRSVSLFPQSVFLLLIAILPAAAQDQAAPDGPKVKLDADAGGCVDSSILPKLPFCRIDNCEKKESDHRDIPIKENDKGEPVTAPIDGESRAVMYECHEGSTPSDLVQQAAEALKVAGFEVPYQFVDKEGSLTARKGDQWVLLEAAARFYTLTELKAVSDLESATDAVAMADAIEHYGHVPAYGIQFMPGRADLSPESEVAIGEVAAMLNEHPDWRVRIVGHTDNTGAKDANVALSMRRAATVVTLLIGKGIKKTRLEVAGAGDGEPVADNDTETGRAKNRRIEVVKL